MHQATSLTAAAIGPLLPQALPQKLEVLGQTALAAATNLTPENFAQALKDLNGLLAEEAIARLLWKAGFRNNGSFEDIGMLLLLLAHARKDGLL